MTIVLRRGTPADAAACGPICLEAFKAINDEDERGPITGVGPITVDPKSQNGTIRRQLMGAVLNRATERHAAGVRLLQPAFHNRSLCLYTKLGFETRETVS